MRRAILKTCKKVLERSKQTPGFLRKFSTAPVRPLCSRPIIDNDEPSYLPGQYFIDDYYKYDHITRIPRKLDWFTRGLATDVRSQDIFGTCNVIAAVGAVESAEAIFRNRKVRCSVQEPIDFCRWNCGVYGGNIGSIFDFIAARGGLCSESDYPYKGIHMPYSTRGLPRFGQIAGFQHADTWLRFFQALSQQPLAAGMRTTPEYVKYDGEGVLTTPFKSEQYDAEVKRWLEYTFDKKDGEPTDLMPTDLAKAKAEARQIVLTRCLNHAVLVVGYELKGDGEFIDLDCEGEYLKDSILKVLESSGTRWGAGGLCDIHIDVAKSMGMDLGAYFPVL